MTSSADTSSSAGFGRTEFGAHGVLVLGDPDYYGRFGFAAAKAAGVTCPFRGNPAFQALAIAADAFDRPLTVAYPDAFGA